LLSISLLRSLISISILLKVVSKLSWIKFEHVLGDG
jgi:hypothetical protein